LVVRVIQWERIKTPSVKSGPSRAWAKTPAPVPKKPPGSPQGVILVIRGSHLKGGGSKKRTLMAKPEVKRTSRSWNVVKLREVLETKDKGKVTDTGKTVRAKKKTVHSEKGHTCNP